MKSVKSWFARLFSEERRRAPRHRSLPLVAYYWDGGEPVAHGILDASATGFYLLTQHRWYPDTVLAMTLQRVRAAATDSTRAIAVNARAVRAGADGVGLAFVFTEGDRSLQARSLPTKAAGRRELRRFLKRVHSDNGRNL